MIEDTQQEQLNMTSPPQFPGLSAIDPSITVHNTTHNDTALSNNDNEYESDNAMKTEAGWKELTKPAKQRKLPENISPVVFKN